MFAVDKLTLLYTTAGKPDRHVEWLISILRQYILKWVLKKVGVFVPVTVLGLPSGERCIKGKQDTVNCNCTVCDFNPWRVLAGANVGIS